MSHQKKDQASDPGTIVFIDGVCVLCGATAKWLARRDKDQVLYFAALQSAFAEQLLGSDHTREINYIALLDEGQLYTRSEAVVRILLKLGPGYRFLGRVFSIIPRFLRDACYDLVARMRYSLFGQKASCEIPDPRMRDRFLDKEESIYGQSEVF